MYMVVATYRCAVVLYMYICGGCSIWQRRARPRWDKHCIINSVDLSGCGNRISPPYIYIYVGVHVNQAAKSNPTYSIYNYLSSNKETIIIKEDIIFASVLPPLAAYS